MLIHRTRTDRTAPRQTDLGRPEARHERTERQHRRAHGLHKLVGSNRTRHRTRVERHVRAAALDAHAHARQQLQHRANVREIGHVVQHKVIRRQKSGGKDGQRGVFGARSADFSDKAASAADF